MRKIPTALRNSQMVLRASLIKRPEYLVSRMRDRAVGEWDAVLNWAGQLGDPVHSRVVNRNEYRILGLRRSGNHAVISWMEHQLPGSIHLNNLRVNENPYRNFYRACAKLGHATDSWMAKEIRRYPEYRGPDGVQLLRNEALGHFRQKENLLVSYEDYPIPSVTNSRFEALHDRYFGVAGSRYDVLILRDPYNLLASRLQAGMLRSKSLLQSFASLWIAYAREFLDETRYLTNEKVTINYNRWVLDDSYRRLVAERLGMDFSDRGRDKVADFGGGSSFDDTGFDGRANEMDLMNRWKLLQDNAEFRRLTRNRGLRLYAERIFSDPELTYPSE